MPDAGSRPRPFRRQPPCRYGQLSSPIAVIADIVAARGQDAATAWLPIMPAI